MCAFIHRCRVTEQLPGTWTTPSEHHSYGVHGTVACHKAVDNYNFTVTRYNSALSNHAYKIPIHTPFVPCNKESEVQLCCIAQRFGQAVTPILLQAVTRIPTPFSILNHSKTSRRVLQCSFMGGFSALVTCCAG
jgi:hypothetical protein